MKLVDVNLLLYAVNRDSVHHGAAKTWLERLLSGEEPVALPWVVLLAFLRISTNHRVLPRPVSPDQAIKIVDDWLDQPIVRLLHPGEGHWAILKDLLSEAGTAANLTTDAHLAALAVENGCELCSTDTDFQRFRRLKWTNPLVGS